MLYKFCLCALEIVGWVTRIKSRETVNWPIFIRHFWRRYWRYRKTEGAMTYYSSRAFTCYKFYVCALKIRGGVTRIKSRETVKWPIFRRHFWRRYWRYRKTKGAMTCYSSRAFMWYRFRSCALKTLGGVSRTKFRTKRLGRTDRRTDRQTKWKQYPRFGG